MAREATRGGEAIRALGGHALARDRVGGRAHLRLLLARLPQPRADRVRRDRRPLVGGVRARSRSSSGPVEQLLSRTIAERQARGRADRRSRCGSRRRSSSALAAGVRASRRSRSGSPIQDDLSPAARRSTGSSSPRSSPSPPASSPGASWPGNRRFGLYGGAAARWSRPRGCRSPSRSRVGIAERRRPRWRSASSPRRVSQPDRGPARVRGQRGRADAGAAAAGRRDGSREFTLARGGGFAAAVLLIMVSEQTLLNAGPAARPRLRGRRGGRLHLQRADDRPRPAGPLPGGRDQPPPPPHPAALQRRGRATPTPSGSRSGSR